MFFIDEVDIDEVVAHNVEVEHHKVNKEDNMENKVDNDMDYQHKEVAYMAPVSYTHLDVYKRQN